MRFTLPDTTPLRPYVVTAAANRAALAALESDAIRWYDPLDAGDAAYCAALNRANCFAHDDSAEPSSDPGALGMPRWVMLDCCLLPSAMSGFEAPREALPRRVADQLDPGGDLEWIGVSEYVALPSVRPSEFVGVSLFSLVRGRGLGVRTKALGLRIVGARGLTGVTQFTNPGVRVHLAFGPLEVVSASVAIHSRPAETFVYRLVVPGAAELSSMEAPGDDGPTRHHDLPSSERLVIDPRAPDQVERVRAAMRSGGRWFITTAGEVVDGAVSRLVLSRMDER